MFRLSCFYLSVQIIFQMGVCPQVLTFLFFTFRKKKGKLHEFSDGLNAASDEM